MSNEKKPFFLKRWIGSLCRWLDKHVFPSAPERAGSVAVPLGWSLVMGFVLGIVEGISSFFKGNTDTFNNIVGIIALAAVVVLIVLFLIKDLPAFDSIGKKIGRSVFVVLLCGVAFVIGCYLAVLVMFVVIGIGVLWVLLQVISGDSSSGKKKSSFFNTEDRPEQEEFVETITLDNNVVLTNKQGSWIDNASHEWKQDSDGGWYDDGFRLGF